MAQVFIPGPKPHQLAFAGQQWDPSMGLSPNDIDIAARTIWGEARGESDLGRQAVAEVGLNRWANSGGQSLAEIFQAPKQFSPWNSGGAQLMGLSQSNPGYQQGISALQAALGPDDPTKGATHFHANYVQPSWAAKMQPTTTIGAHQYYNANGSPADALAPVLAMPPSLTKPARSTSMPVASLPMPPQKPMRTTTLPMPPLVKPSQIPMPPLTKPQVPIAMPPALVKPNPGLPMPPVKPAYMVSLPMPPQKPGGKGGTGSGGGAGKTSSQGGQQGGKSKGGIGPRGKQGAR